MSWIFVSYSRQDKQAVARLAAVMRKDGHHVSMDDAIHGGAFWREKLAEAIQAAEIFVIVLSRHSIDSGEVRIELELAADDKKPIIPVLVERVDIPTRMKHALAGKNRIDLYTDPAAGHESLRAALDAVVAAAPGASFITSAIEARRVPPAVPTAPAKRPKAEPTRTADPTRAAIEAGQNLIEKYDELIERLDSTMSKSLYVILPGTWKVSIGVLRSRWTFTLEKSGAFKAEREATEVHLPGLLRPPRSLEGTWAVASEESVEFSPGLNPIRSIPFDFTFGEIDRKQLGGTTNFTGESVTFLPEDGERSETTWRRA